MSHDPKLITVDIRYEFVGDSALYECFEYMIEDGDLSGVLEVAESRCDIPRMVLSQEF